MDAFNETKKFVILGILAAIAFIGIYIATNKKTEGEWVCKNNRWVAQGEPPTEKPLGACK
jgi:hypothetical protein